MNNLEAFKRFANKVPAKRIVLIEKTRSKKHKCKMCKKRTVLHCEHCGGYTCKNCFTTILKPAKICISCVFRLTN